MTKNNSFAGLLATIPGVRVSGRARSQRFGLPRGKSKGFALSLATLSLLTCWLPSNANARPEGLASECSNCHYGGDGPMVEVDFAKQSLELSETVDLTVRLTVVAEDGLRTGLMLRSDGQGDFGLLEENTKKESALIVLHSAPKEFVDGGAEFKFTWTAPAERGVSNFEVWTISGNGNKQSADDNHTKFEFGLSHGCEGGYYFLDTDGDGFGSDDTRIFACDPPAGYVPDGNDCNEESIEQSPAAVEVCNSRDDNCDGTTDEGFTPVVFFPDSDGDGFGQSGGETKFGCGPFEGFAPNVSDCDDFNAAINTCAVEVANGVDDNCNGQVDEPPQAVPEECGADDTAGAGGAPSTPSDVPSDPADPGAGAEPVLPTGVAGAASVPTTMPVANPPSAGASGCALAPRQRSGTSAAMLLLIGCAALVASLRRRGPIAG